MSRRTETSQRMARLEELRAKKKASDDKKLAEEKRLADEQRERETASSPEPRESYKSAVYDDLLGDFSTPVATVAERSRPLAQMQDQDSRIFEPRAASDRRDLDPYPPVSDRTPAAAASAASDRRDLGYSSSYPPVSDRTPAAAASDRRDLDHSNSYPRVYEESTADTRRMPYPNREPQLIEELYSAREALESSQRIIDVYHELMTDISDQIKEHLRTIECYSEKNKSAALDYIRRKMQNTKPDVSIEDVEKRFQLEKTSYEDMAMNYLRDLSTKDIPNFLQRHSRAYQGLDTSRRDYSREEEMSRSEREALSHVTHSDMQRAVPNVQLSRGTGVLSDSDSFDDEHSRGVVSTRHQHVRGNPELHQQERVTHTLHRSHARTQSQPYVEQEVMEEAREAAVGLSLKPAERVSSAPTTPRTSPTTTGVEKGK